MTSTDSFHGDCLRLTAFLRLAGKMPQRPTRLRRHHFTKSPGGSEPADDLRSLEISASVREQNALSPRSATRFNDGDSHQILEQTNKANEKAHSLFTQVQLPSTKGGAGEKIYIQKRKQQSGRQKKSGLPIESLTLAPTSTDNELPLFDV